MRFRSLIAGKVVEFVKDEPKTQPVPKDQEYTNKQAEGICTQSSINEYAQHESEKE